MGQKKKKFNIGDHVRKSKGSQWHGHIVGTYSTELTPDGYAVESNTEKGSVQIYPAAALELVVTQPQTSAWQDSPVLKWLVPMLRRGEALPGHQEEAAVQLEQLNALSAEIEQWRGTAIMLEQANAAIAQLTGTLLASYDESLKASKGEWISVNERLPDIAQEVIVFAVYDRVCCANLNSFNEWFAPQSDYQIIKVTHWRPLPPAPEFQ